jgi:hypothetical protein
MASHAQDAHADYHRGDMDIHEQVHTWTVFKLFAKWGSLITGVGLLFLTMWFCTNTGFIGSFITAVVLMAIGILVLRERKGAAH